MLYVLNLREFKLNKVYSLIFDNLAVYNILLSKNYRLNVELRCKVSCFKINNTICCKLLLFYI